jgi:GNAT superfamily N-acetyltransferase
MDIELINKHLFLNSNALKVSFEQTAYVCGDLQAFVRQWADDPEFDCFLIRKASEDVGFFAIDLNLERHPYAKPYGCVLRCFFIDERHQGRGLAQETLAKLDQVLIDKYPEVNRCYLTVNFKNEMAAAVYKKSGFAIIGDPYLGGASGPQHVMCKRLNNKSW